MNESCQRKPDNQSVHNNNNNNVRTTCTAQTTCESLGSPFQGWAQQNRLTSDLTRLNSTQELPVTWVILWEAYFPQGEDHTLRSLPSSRRGSHSEEPTFLQEGDHTLRSLPSSRRGSHSKEPTFLQEGITLWGAYLPPGGDHTLRSLPSSRRGSHSEEPTFLQEGSHSEEPTPPPGVDHTKGPTFLKEWMLLVEGTPCWSWGRGSVVLSTYPQAQGTLHSVDKMKYLGRSRALWHCYSARSYIDYRHIKALWL